LLKWPPEFQRDTSKARSLDALQRFVQKKQIPSSKAKAFGSRNHQKSQVIHDLKTSLWVNDDSNDMLVTINGQ
jgi:hypothetical protein